MNEVIEETKIKNMMQTKVRKSRYRVTRMWSCLLALATLSACQHVQDNGDEKTNIAASNEPVFQHFEYVGNDKIYAENPLPEGIFTARSYRDVILIPALPAREMTIIW